LSVESLLKFILTYTLLWLVAVPAAVAQFSGRAAEPIPTPLHIALLPDSVRRTFNENSAVAKALSTPDTIIRGGKSTTTALLASMVVPGAGQIYNGSYWKVPLIWGLEYYFISVYRNQNNLYAENRRLYLAALDSATVTGSAVFQYDASRYLTIRDFYKKQRDTFGWYIAIAYLVNLLDAYVDASLYNFEVSPNLQPTNGLRATLQVHF